MQSRLLYVLAAIVAIGALANPAVALERPVHGGIVKKPVANPSPTASPGLQYRSIGPAISGGRVAAVTGSNRNASLYYIGAAGGGVFKSVDAGYSWAQTWRGTHTGSIGALAIDPNRDDDVWAGTGEANPRNDVSWGNGMWRSHDGGKTWQHVGLEKTSQIAKISIDPAHAEIVVVAALGNPYVDTRERGIYRTVDGGAHWTQTLFIDGGTGAADLARDPHDPNVLYAAMWKYRRYPWKLESGGGRDGLYKSSDGGLTWHEISGNGFPAGTLGRIGIAIAPRDHRLLYAVVQSKAGTIWRSTDAGSHWQRMSGDTIPEQRPFYFSHVAVDPRNSKHVVSVSMYLSESKDAGKTWKHLTSTNHVDNHALWWSADGKRLINGNDGGVALSQDGGETWSMPLDLAIGQTYHVGYSDAEPYDVCAGFQDNSAWCGPVQSNNGIGIIERDWTAIAGGDGMWALFDPSDPTKIWNDTQDGSLAIYDRTTHESVDVEPWPRDAFTSLSGLQNNAYRFNWDSPLAFSPADPATAYYGGNVIFKTTDRGRSWKPISGDLTRNEKQHQSVSGGSITLDVSGAEAYDTLLDITPSTVDAKTIWAGSDDGLLHVTHDAGATWQNVTPSGLPRYARIECIEASRTDAGTVYVVADRHDLGDRAPYLFVTSDAGKSWRRTDASLPRDESLHVVRMDAKNPSILYAGTENGIYYSLDAGRRWVALQLNLPAAPIYDLQIQPQRNDLVVATHGRSLWVLDDLTPIERIAQAGAAGNAATLFPVRPGIAYQQWQPIETGDGGSLPANFFIGPNPKGPALITFYQPKPARERPEIDILDASGKIIRHLRGSYRSDDGTKYWVTNAAGYNRLAWDGNEDGPVLWNRTSIQNMGPTSGAPALPGTYTIRLRVDGRTSETPFELRGDPHMAWTVEEAAAHHAFLADLYAKISAIDVDLNAIDARLHGHRGKPVSRMQRASLERARDLLTADDEHDEDSIARPDRVREQLFALTGPLSSSGQPPFAAHTAAASAVFATYDRVMAEVRRLIET